MFVRYYTTQQKVNFLVVLFFNIFPHPQVDISDNFSMQYVQYYVSPPHLHMFELQEPELGCITEVFRILRLANVMLCLKMFVRYYTTLHKVYYVSPPHMHMFECSQGRRLGQLAHVRTTWTEGKSRAEQSRHVSRTDVYGALEHMCCQHEGGRPIQGRELT